MNIAELKPSEDLAVAELYLNRELSLLEFNRRVREHAKDPATPLLERPQVLCISSTNLDEFFRNPVARLHEQVASGRAGRA